MEEISFAVVTKPYEVWDFYNGSSGNLDGDFLLKLLSVNGLTTTDLQS
jgi:hypothetical protein